MANISIVPLGATIGARVEGIDFSEPLTEALRDAIRAAIGEHKVLVFKGEPLPVAVFALSQESSGRCRNTSCGSTVTTNSRTCPGSQMLRKMAVSIPLAWFAQAHGTPTVAIPKTLRNLACYTPLKCRRGAARRYSRICATPTTRSMRICSPE